MRENIQFIETVYVASSKNAKNQIILLKTARLAKISVTIMQVIYVTSILVYTINPTMAFVTKGEFELILHVFIPGTDPKKPIGYTVNLCFQAMMVFFGLVGTCASDIYCFTTVIHMLPIQKIFKKSIRELNKMLVRSQYSEAALQLRNIQLMHKDIYM